MHILGRELRHEAFLKLSSSPYHSFVLRISELISVILRLKRKGGWTQDISMEHMAKQSKQEEMMN